MSVYMPTGCIQCKSAVHLTEPGVTVGRERLHPNLKPAYCSSLISSHQICFSNLLYSIL